MLFRAAAAIRVYETALADLGHATLATAGGGFFERPEVVDLVAYVTALANPLDDARPLRRALLAAVRRRRRLARRARARARASATARCGTCARADPPDARAAAFVERLRAAARARAAARPLAAIVAAGVSEHGYDLHLAGLHAPERRIANVRKLEQLAREFERARGARPARASRARSPPGASARRARRRRRRRPPAPARSA